MEKHTILLVDDDPFILIGIGKTLESEGYQVTTADSGEKAIELLNKSSFDMVITDLVMQGIDGIDVLKKAKDHNSETMVIILTGHGNMESAIDAFRIGVDDYISKPCESEELRFWVEGCLAKLESQRKLKAAEEALSRAKEELEIEVERRTFELMKTNEHLKREIEERNQVEEALRKSEAQKKAILDGITTNLAFVNEKLEILWANKAAATSVNKSPEEMIGHKCHALWADRDPPCDGCPTLKAFKTRTSEHSIMYTPDGRVWDEKGEPVFDDKGNLIGVLEIAHDITETKLLQDSLIRSERLAAIGKLAASIAHEINSPLQGITALLNLIQTTGKQDEELLTNIDLLKGAAYSIRDTVQKLLDLNRPGKERKQPVNVNKIIDDTVALMRTHLKKNKVNVNLNLSSEVPHIKASSQQLGHVFMNLINNAVEAMNGVSQKNARKQQIAVGGDINIDTYLSMDSLVIKVTDTGPGIPDKALEHIFDPFYTKKKTMGMGVGLSVCHDIIEKHKGIITAMNSPEGGAVFTLTLPVDQIQSR